MWRQPKMVAWFVVAFLLLFVVRLPFAPLAMVPYFVEFHPGFVLLPILGICWGPPAAWAALAAGLVGDSLLGYWDSVSFFRAIGWMVAVLCTQRLYHPPTSTNDSPPNALRSITHFLVASIPACCVAAVFPAFQAGFLRYYPFCYIVALMFVNNLVFLLLFGPGLFRLLAHHTQGKISLWHHEPETASLTGSHRFFSNLLLWVGSVGGLVAGLLVSGWVYDAWPWSLYLVGTSSGHWVRIVVAVFLVILLLGLAWPIWSSWFRRGKTATRKAPASAFRNLYLPPGR